MKITDTGLTIAQTVARLYNASRVQGMGIFMQVDGDMSVQAAAEEVNTHTHSSMHGKTTSFDYLHGRTMKVWFEGDSSDFDPSLYDRDNGKGAAERAVKGEDSQKISGEKMTTE